jgi:ATP-dependent Clp protease, protease subunit
MFKLLLAFFIAAPPLVFGENQSPFSIILTEENTVSFNQPVRDLYVAKKQEEIIKKSAKLPLSKPLYLVLDTPGGSVIDGLLFIDTIKSLNRPIHTITIFAASMGYQIAQELGTRYILPSGTLMSHRGAVSGLSGQVPGELNSRLSHLEELLSRMNVAAAKRTGVSIKAYQDSIVNELWASGHQAVKTKQADAVVFVKCDKKLMDKTFEEEVSTFLGSIKVQYSACPLISAPVGFGLGSSFSPIQVQQVKQQIKNEKRRINLTF